MGPWNHRRDIVNIKGKLRKERKGKILSLTNKKAKEEKVYKKKLCSTGRQQKRSGKRKRRPGP